MSIYTLENTKKIKYLGNELIIPNNLPYRDCTPTLEKTLIHINENSFETIMAKKLPLNYSFLDIGGHIGNTTIPVSFYCKHNNREDIRFYIFEPDKKKCEYIQFIVNINNLNLKVYNTGVGDKQTQIIFDMDRYKRKKRAIGRGSMRYKEEISSNDNDNNNNNIDMIKMDSIKEIVNPVGYIHIDTEGWDSRVIDGSYEIIKKNLPPIFCELSNKEYETSNIRVIKTLKEINNNYEQITDLNINKQKFKFAISERASIYNGLFMAKELF